MSPIMNRREAMAALASTAALPLLHGCGNQSAATNDGGRGQHGADAQSYSTRLARTTCGSRRKARPPSASTPTRARRCARSLPIDPPKAREDRRTRSAWTSNAPRRLMRQASRTPLGPASRWCVARIHCVEGFALPYGDITVGSWRNTPYVVIQNVGAYLDHAALPRQRSSN